MTSFIPFRLQPVDLSLYYSHSFRSHHFHNNAKHCFEGKYLSGTVAFHFGFSPFKDSRQLVSLIKYKDQYVQFFQHINGVSDVYSQPEITYDISEDQTYLVCLNTDNNQILAFFGDFNVNYTFQSYQNYDEWYAFVDAPIQANSKPSHVSVNLGYRKFKHPVPEGYLPWIIDVDGLFGTKKKFTLSLCHSLFPFSPCLSIFFLSSS